MLIGTPSLIHFLWGTLIIETLPLITHSLLMGFIIVDSQRKRRGPYNIGPPKETTSQILLPLAFLDDHSMKNLILKKATTKSRGLSRAIFRGGGKGG